MKFTNSKLISASFTALLSLPFLTAASPITPAEPTTDKPQVPGILTSEQITALTAEGVVFQPKQPEVTLAASTSALFNFPADASARRGPSCNTSDASAEVWEVQSAIDFLKGLPANTLCVQTNGWGSYCTQMVSHGGAQISLCGSYGSTLTCSQAADLALDVKNFCERGGRAGGVNYWDNYTRVIVH